MPDINIAPPPATKPGRKRIIFLIIFLLSAGAVFVYWWTGRGFERTDDAFIESNVVTLSTRVAGYVTELKVADNQLLAKGDTVLQIDPTDYEIAVEQAQANADIVSARLSVAQQNLETVRITAPSNLESTQSQVSAAEATWQNALKELKRIQALNTDVRTKQQLDNVTAAERTARAQLAEARARNRGGETVTNAIASAEASVKELEANIALTDASLKQAQKNLADTTLRAPFAGRVTRRQIEPGTYLQPGQQIMNLVGTEVWVVANFKETQLTHMRPGQAVDIEIDAYPGRSYKAHVDSLQVGTGARFSAFPAENATGNFVKVIQRVPVKIVFDEALPTDLSLGAGMSVVPKVRVAE